MKNKPKKSNVRLPEKRKAVPVNLLTAKTTVDWRPGTNLRKGTKH